MSPSSDLGWVPPDSSWTSSLHTAEAHEKNMTSGRRTNVLRERISSWKVHPRVLQEDISIPCFDTSRNFHKAKSRKFVSAKFVRSSPHSCNARQPVRAIVSVGGHDGQISMSVNLMHLRYLSVAGSFIVLHDAQGIHPYVSVTDHLHQLDRVANSLRNFQAS